MNPLFNDLSSIAWESGRYAFRDTADQWAKNFLARLANEIRDEFPDPNPLGSLFDSYVGEWIAEYIEGLGA